MPEKPPPLHELEPIPGDTFAVRAELKALGAVWDTGERLWRIVPDRLPLALAIVENQSLAPPAASLSAADVEAMPDPFEEEGGSRLIPLENRTGGATYAARDALRAVGAQWDKERRSWMIREDRAAYAQAIVASVAAGGGAAAPPSEIPPPDTDFRPALSRRSVAGDEPKENKPVAGRTRQEEKPPLANTVSTVAFREERATRTPPAAPPQGVIRPMAADRIKLGGLWLNRTKDGREYLSGRLSPTVKILIFKNDFKSTDNQPSHVMYLAPIEQDENQRPNTPAPDSFFGDFSESSRAGNGAASDGDFDGDDFADDAYLGEEEAPPPPPVARPARPAAPPAARPQNGNAPSPAANRPAPGRPASAGPAQTSAPARRPAANPPAAASRRPAEPVEEDMEDPFAE